MKIFVIVLCFIGFAVLGLLLLYRPSILSNPVNDTGFVTGIVSLGPTCPVMRIGDPACNDKLFNTSLSVYDFNTKLGVIDFSSDLNGKFSIQLLQGDYYIGNLVGAGVYPRCSSQNFKLETGKTVNVNVTCDTGIR